MSGLVGESKNKLSCRDGSVSLMVIFLTNDTNIANVLIAISTVKYSACIYRTYKWFWWDLILGWELYVISYALNGRRWTVSPGGGGGGHITVIQSYKLIRSQSNISKLKGTEKSERSVRNWTRYRFTEVTTMTSLRWCSVTKNRPTFQVISLSRDTITADQSNFYFLISTSYCRMSPTTQNKIEQVFWGWSTGLQGWQWITIDFWEGCPEIKASILVKFELLGIIFVLSRYFFAYITFSIFFSYCNTIKLNYSKLQAVLIKYYDSGVTVSL